MDGLDVSDGNEILVKFTYYGDSDLDGRVAGSDFNQFAAGKSGDGTGWAFGDYDYTGSIPTGDDFNAFAAGKSGYTSGGVL
jgi:hypothetical protein